MVLERKPNEIVNLGAHWPGFNCGLLPKNQIDDGVYALNLQVLTELWRRSHHHTPTLEEITHKFQESTVFSKLDTRDGYWSVVLRELPTTF